MEMRQLEAFVAVAAELHFGRAAETLGIGQPTLSDLIRKLERECGMPLLMRTTRRVAITAAGEELLGRAHTVLAEVAAAKTAMRRMAAGEAGTVTVAITPPVAPVLAPHLHTTALADLPGVTLDVQRMWLPELHRALADGDADVAITCGHMPQSPGVVNAVFCSEPLLVGLRPDHTLAHGDAVTLEDLAGDRLGVPSEKLFPNWAVAQRQALEEAGVSPPLGALDATDLSAPRWTAQPDIDWVFVTESLGMPPDTIVLPIRPDGRLPYTLQWSPERARTAAVARFVKLALTCHVPPGWRFEQGHLLHSSR